VSLRGCIPDSPTKGPAARRGLSAAPAGCHLRLRPPPAAQEADDVGHVARLGEQYQHEDARLRALWDEWVRVGESMEG
jgi:hypothetical protein